MSKQKKPGFRPEQKKTNVVSNQADESSQPQQKQERTVSPTIRILQKIYGETAPESVWPDLVDDGGYVILGCEILYNRGSHEFSNKMPPEHTWCRWGWDMGAPVRFGSVVDAEAFVKSLSLPDERGRILSRSYAPMVFFAGANDDYAFNDDALPRKNYYEDDE